MIVKFRTLIVILILFFSAPAKAQDAFEEENKIDKLLDEDKKFMAVRPHMISFNPFLVPVLSPNLRYNYVFGKKMNMAAVGRVTYVSSILELLGFESLLMLGGGFKYIPYYHSWFSIGLDITPTYMRELNSSEHQYSVLFPLNFNFDLLPSKHVGLAFDAGAAYVVGNLLEDKVVPRFHLGLMFMFGQPHSVNPLNDSRF